MASSVMQKLEDVTECSICCGTYNDPRQLPCLHSFCLKCLQGYARSQRSMSCPMCRKKTKLPHEGIDGLPRNFFIEKIMEIKRLSGPVSEGTKCDVCFEDEEVVASATDVPVASMYCANCHRNLCTRCTVEHRRHMKTHSIMELGSNQAVEQLAKTFVTSYCSSHPQDTVRMFCLDCNVVMCFVCFAEKHQMHKCSDINKEAKIFCKQIESDVKGVSNCLSAYQESVMKMEEKRDNFLKQIETVEKDIFRRSNRLKEVIERDTAALLDELKSIKSSQLKEMCVKTEELDRNVTILNSFKTYGEEMIALGSASDICHSFNQFHNRYSEILGNYKEPPFHDYLPKSVTFRTTAMNEVQQKNLLGRIEDLSCKNKGASDCLHIFLSMNLCEEYGRLMWNKEEMCRDPRQTQEWQDFPFKIKQMSEVDGNLFVISIFTLMPNFTNEQYEVPEGIDVDDLAALVTGSVTPDETQMLVFEREKRFVTLIGSRAKVEMTKRSIEMMAGKKMSCCVSPESSCQREDMFHENRLPETEDDDYNEREFIDEDDDWRIATPVGYIGFTEIPSVREKKAEMKYEKACWKKNKYKQTLKSDWAVTKKNKAH